MYHPVLIFFYSFLNVLFTYDVKCASLIIKEIAID
jgi:hypothetical protein